MPMGLQNPIAFLAMCAKILAAEKNEWKWHTQLHLSEAARGQCNQAMAVASATK